MKKVLFLLIIGCLMMSCHNENTVNEMNSKIYEGFDSYQNFGDLHVLENYLEGIECAKQSGRPIFLQFNVHGACFDEFKEDFIRSRSFRKLLNDNYVTVLLHVDDRKKLTNEGLAEVGKISLNERFAEELKLHPTLGRFNSFIQLQKYESNAQPLYAIMNSDEQNIIEPFDYQGHIDSIMTKLKLGLQNK